jgi:hypothetical protein
MGERGLFFDAFSGAAGDMLVASLLDLGASLERLRSDLEGLGIDGLELKASQEWQGGLAGTRFEVSAATDQPRRHLPQILALLGRSSLPSAVRDRAARVFRRIGEAEAKVHGCAIDAVHFHEVGAVDSIVDVVGFCLLHEQLGAPPILCSPLAIGEGFVQTEHGKIPVPAMATLELLRGVPVEMSGIAEELVTPTGAALLGTLSESFGRHHAFTPKAIGYGLGTRQRENPPNAIRAVLFERPTSARERVEVIEVNLDDMTGQELSRVLQLCLEAGALDVTLLTATMKKGRPGQVLQVLAPTAERDALSALLFTETSTLGMRTYPVERWILERAEETRPTRFGEVRGKRIVGRDGRREWRPEFDELSRLAREQGRSLAEVRRAVEADTAGDEDASEST